MMAQYLAIKRAHEGYLLFYRMGDFYELFFDDAVQASAALDIALTKRGKHQGADIPMCGVPVHSAESYLHTLIAKGFKVAVCEQTEDPAEAKKRGGKAVVARDVKRIVTPGTLTEDELLDARRHNYLAAVARVGGTVGLAWADMSDGGFHVCAVDDATLGHALARIEPAELLVPDALTNDEAIAALVKDLGPRATLWPAIKFDSTAGERAIKAQFKVAALDAFGAFSRAEIAAAGAVLAYLELTQKGKLPALAPPRQESERRYMGIDAATRRNLELVETLSGERNGSLLATIDRTATSAGGRELGERMLSPLTDVASIAARLDGVGYFVSNRAARDALRAALRRAPDMARALARLSVGRGGPRDLGALRDALAVALSLHEIVGRGATAIAPPAGEVKGALATLDAQLKTVRALAEKLARLLGPDLPLFARDGGFVAVGQHRQLDELRALRDDARRVIVELEGRLKAETGIGSLKVRHNNVLGYHIDITTTNSEKLKTTETGRAFIHRQTTAQAQRYTNSELSELASKIADAGGQALALETQLFDEMVADVAQVSLALNEIAQAMAVLDVSAALAEYAVETRCVRPEIDGSLAFRIERGRHPVVEAALARANEGFVANDCDLSPEGAGRLWLVTGPNMAGKSTFLRQNALIAILAQMGAFVPAASAAIGVVDRLFSRVGAADDLARGRSTFMVEMVETAVILNQATERSLVILDEIGRGTATFDGLSIAWAAAEHLHGRTKSRALFATHYHELTALAQRHKGIANVTVRVKEWHGGIVFLHEVAPGAADRSYGIQVAKLAGLPGEVLARAQEVLDALERGDMGRRTQTLIDELPLFSAARAKTPVAVASQVEAELKALALDEMSPREALDALYRLKALAAKDG
ncbi:MAG: DNA mismatch repair protein MutS [Alphaproteobacteria bacterium]|nr:DNA mismatch repair protein MutS [Alphaproteobacteria bacterium]